MTADFIVVKKTNESRPTQASDWEAVAIVPSVEGKDLDELRANAITMAYSGEGTYRALEWTEEAEAVVGPPASPEVTMQSERAVAEAVEAQKAEADGR